jgi:signal transduction histidine kinase/ActR/RegA family two-component response regulator
VTFDAASASDATVFSPLVVQYLARSGTFVHLNLQSLLLHHDWRAALLAVAIGYCGVIMAYKLLAEARKGPHRGRRIKGLGAMVVGSLTIWSIHFIAMQGYAFGAPVRYDIGLTVLSYLTAIGSTIVTFIISVSGKTPFWRAVAGASGAIFFVSMVWLSVSGLQVQGRVEWNWPLVLLGYAAAAGLAGLAGWLNDARDTARLLLASAVATSAVLAAHFILMPAHSLVFEMGAPFNPRALSPAAMQAWVTAAVAIIILSAGFLGGLFYWSRHSAIAQIREAVEAMPDGMGFYDAQDRLILWNGRYAEVNPEVAGALRPGMTFREILQIGVDQDLYAEALGREQEWIHERLKARRAVVNSMEQRTTTGRWLRVQDRRTAEGGIVTVVSDITEMKRDAEALAEARDAAEDANRAKSQFLANMSHEIRTPLNGVIGLSQVLARTDLDEEQRRMLELIQSSSRTLQTLLSDILDLARVESGRLTLTNEAFDMAEAVREAGWLYADAARDKGLQFFVDVAPEAEIWVRGDVVRLKQVLTNLVSNAVKFTAEGLVSLTVERAAPMNGRTTLRFTIQDTGIGFDEETRARLFTRFEQADGAITRRFGGSGLGLAICRQLTELMGGALDCESEPGGGSAFILTLPVEMVDAPHMAVAPKDATDLSEGRRLRVLSADDHPVNRRVVELMMESAGVELVSVADGLEAVAAYRDGGFDLVLMDMQMPAMDGLTATREIRLHEAAMGAPRTPVVMLTANALAEHVEAARAAGADRHLAKPFSAEDLLKILSDLPQGVRTVQAA